MADFNIALQTMAKLISVHFRHHNVAHHDVRLISANHSQTFFSVRSHIDVFEHALESLSHKCAQFALIIYYKNRIVLHAEVYGIRHLHILFRTFRLNIVQIVTRFHCDASISLLQRKFKPEGSPLVLIIISTNLSSVLFKQGF